MPPKKRDINGFDPPSPPPHDLILLKQRNLQKNYVSFEMEINLKSFHHTKFTIIKFWEHLFQKFFV